jgi:hypothetical protein
MVVRPTWRDPEGEVVAVREEAVAREVSGVFTDAKTIDSRALNLAGVQPFRAVLARVLYRLRRGSTDAAIAELYRTGILVCENFLPPDAFAAVTREAEDLMNETAPALAHHWGTTEVRHFHLNTADSDRFPQLAEWYGSQQVVDLAAAAERRNCRSSDGGGLLEHLSLGDYSESDTQTELHIDTFHNTHRVWLYLDDVTTENAAFVYVPGSHHLDRVRLLQDYLESTRANTRSRRVSDSEVRSRGLERRVVACPRNTLVVANTCGYHCRSVGEAGATRAALHMTFRFNPFAIRPVISSTKRSAAEWKRRATSR